MYNMTEKDKYNQRKLNHFSQKHYTYINQIFGDITVREIIAEKFPDKYFEFGVAKADEADFDADSDHHFIYNRKTKNYICSIEDGHQDTSKNINDTLCQSYSLVTYFGTKISSNRKKRQMDMIEMYRMLLSDTDFVMFLDRDIICHKKNRKLWKDYTTSKHKHINMEITHILQNIKNVLDKWENYGYHYFIGNGNSPSL